MNNDKYKAMYCSKCKHVSMLNNNLNICIECSNELIKVGIDLFDLIDENNIELSESNDGEEIFVLDVDDAFVTDDD